jgi:arylformamidase
MRQTSAIKSGGPYNVLELRWNTHLLTHLDAPYHFFDDGAAVDQIPPERFMGEAVVIAVDGPAVREEHIPEPAAGLSLLFKTRNSELWDARAYDCEHVYVTAEAARRMVERRVNLAGIDYLSIERSGDAAFPVHRALLGAGIPILEGLDLAGVEPGRYTLIALPLKIAGGDGSPVRAVLI